MTTKINDKIREYANQHRMSEWDVFELAYWHAFNAFSETHINRAYNQWFHGGLCDGPVPFWVNLFFRNQGELSA